MNVLNVYFLFVKYDSLKVKFHYGNCFCGILTGERIIKKRFFTIKLIVILYFKRKIQLRKQ